MASKMVFQFGYAHESKFSPVRSPRFQPDVLRFLSFYFLQKVFNEKMGCRGRPFFTIRLVDKIASFSRAQRSLNLEVM